MATSVSGNYVDILATPTIGNLNYLFVSIVKYECCKSIDWNKMVWTINVIEPDAKYDIYIRLHEI